MPDTCRCGHARGWHTRLESADDNAPYVESSDKSCRHFACRCSQYKPRTDAECAPAYDAGKRDALSEVGSRLNDAERDRARAEQELERVRKALEEVAEMAGMGAFIRSEMRGHVVVANANRTFTIGELLDYCASVARQALNPESPS